MARPHRNAVGTDHIPSQQHGKRHETPAGSRQIMRLLYRKRAVIFSRARGQECGKCPACCATAS
eukprot:51045-Eustigmatos_ZCMA.PRE.1